MLDRLVALCVIALVNKIQLILIALVSVTHVASNQQLSLKINALMLQIVNRDLIKSFYKSIPGFTLPRLKILI